MLSETRPVKVGKWTEPALRVLRERYLMRQGGEVVETPEEMCWRVALTIASGEARYGRSEAAVREVAAAFYDIMIEGDFLPNSPTLMNAGRRLGQCFACFVLPVADAIVDAKDEGIFDAIRAAAQHADEGTAPMSDAGADEDYRRHLAKVLTGRAVLAAVG